MNSTANSNLSQLYSFSNAHGIERLNGLDESHFLNLSIDEKEEAWSFLTKSLALSTERIKGLYLLDKKRAVGLFKEVIATPIVASQVPAERQAAENSRLLMLAYIHSVEPNVQYIAAMSEFANSEFPRIRSAFAQALPTHQVTPDAVAALKEMILTETERLPLASAITKLMVLYGMDYDMHDPLYNSIYMSLRSDNPQEKLSAMKRLEKIQRPDYL